MASSVINLPCHPRSNNTISEIDGLVEGECAEFTNEGIVKAHNSWTKMKLAIGVFLVLASLLFILYLGRSDPVGTLIGSGSFLASYLCGYVMGSIGMGRIWPQRPRAVAITARFLPAVLFILSIGLSASLWAPLLRSAVRDAAWALFSGWLVSLMAARAEQARIRINELTLEKKRILNDLNRIARQNSKEHTLNSQ